MGEENKDVVMSGSERQRLENLQVKTALVSEAQEVLRRTVEVATETYINLKKLDDQVSKKVKDNIYTVLSDAIEAGVAGFYEGVKKARDIIEQA